MGTGACHSRAGGNPEKKSWWPVSDYLIFNYLSKILTYPISLSAKGEHNGNIDHAQREFKTQAG
jgi:hypothetical protein